MKYLFTSEQVCEGHPDKICDKISDAILDSALKEDKTSHMAVEATIKGNTIFLYGEAKTKAKLNYESIVLDVLKDIGYAEDYEIIKRITTQSSEIDNAVGKSKTKAGDQGIMFGYATNETDNFMPLPINIASNIAQSLSTLSKKEHILMPDGKVEVTVEYEGNTPLRINTIVISISHKESITNKERDIYIKNNVINKLDTKYIDKNTKILINPAGRWTIYGPKADSGTTGRKIVCDTYGGMAKVGGGCFSSKDPSKVDRSGAYYARYVSKNIVYHELCDKCEIEISYVIGKEKPISLYIDTFNTNHVSMDKIYEFVNHNFDFSVDNIIKELDLLNVKYYETASFGHFGYNTYSWEKIKKDVII